MTTENDDAINALEKVLAQKRSRIAQLEAECRQIIRSLEILGRRVRPLAKKPVLEFLQEVNTPMTPDEIYSQMVSRGIIIRKGSLYTTLRRLTANGDLFHDRDWNTYVAIR